MQLLQWLNVGYGCGAAPEAPSDACAEALVEVHPTHTPHPHVCLHTSKTRFTSKVMSFIRTVRAAGRGGEAFSDLKKALHV